MTENVKIVRINNAPSIRNADNIIRTEITDLNKILDNIDETGSGQRESKLQMIVA